MPSSKVIEYPIYNPSLIIYNSKLLTRKSAKAPICKSANMLTRSELKRSEPKRSEPFIIQSHRSITSNGK